MFLPFLRSSHNAQLIDITFFVPLKCLRKKQLSGMQQRDNRRCIYSLGPYAFSESEYLPSLVTYKLDPNQGGYEMDKKREQGEKMNVEGGEAFLPSSNYPLTPLLHSCPFNPFQPSTSENTLPCRYRKVHVSLESISPYPKPLQAQNRRKNSKQSEFLRLYLIPWNETWIYLKQG